MTGENGFTDIRNRVAALEAGGGGSGTVTSVALSGGTTGLSVTGSPITTSGTITLGGTLAVANGGTGATDITTARTNLGATTVGANVFTAVDAAAARTAIGAGTGSGTVTSVGGTGTVSGLSLSGTVTTSGNLTLGGTLAVTPANFASQTANTFLAAPNGAPGAPTFRAILAADVPTLNQNTTGSAATLTTSRNFSISGGGITAAAVAFNGSGAVVLNASVDAGHVTLARMANLAANSIIGNNTGSPSTPLALTAAQVRTLINVADGATANTGTVTSVSGTGTVSGLTLSGTVTTSGNLTLGGTLSTTSASISDFNSASRAQTEAALVAGANITLTPSGSGASRQITIASSGGGGGGVTSVDVSGGTTGLSFTGGPITTSGTITASGTLDLDNGGTGSTTATGARTNLGAAASGAVTASGITMTTARILGRTTAATGAIEEISVGAGLTLSAGTLSASGGGSDPWTYIKLGSDFVTGSATAVDITGLAFTPAASTDYEFEAVLYLRTATATVGPRPGLAWPTGLTDGVARILTPSSATAFTTVLGNFNAALLGAVGGLPNTTQSYPAFIKGAFVAGGSPSGTIKIQLASETAATNVTAKAGSYIKYRII